jgi:ankyrin repeat protein
MLKAAPDAVIRQNIDGETALHLACGASSEEVQELIIESCPVAAGMVDNDGETPLHLAVISGASLSVICQLVKANPYTVMRPNHRNRTPFDNLSRSYKNARSLKQLEDNPLDMFDDYQKALLFLRVAAWCCGVFLSGEGSGEGSEIPHVLGPPAPLFLSHVPRGYRCLPLHVVSWIHCPRALVKTLVTFYSDQCLVRDSFGSTPLCLAAAASTREDPEEYDYAEESGDESGDEGRDPQTKPTQSVMNIILTANRKAAEIPNIQGRLPLAIALENGKAFEEVLPLIQAYPRSLVIKDPTTGLYPFMTAAAVIPTKRHPSLLSTVYDLLRMQPDLVMG